MTNRAAAVSAAAVAAAVLVGFGPTRADKPPEKRKPIPVAELEAAGVLGRLGQPLGTVVTIEGVVADEKYERPKIDDRQILLLVRRVNGTKLAKEQVFCFSDPTKSFAQPKANAAFKYLGYETGGFEGVPEQVWEHFGRSAVAGFGFQTHFHFLRDELVKRE